MKKKSYQTIYLISLLGYIFNFKNCDSPRDPDLLWTQVPHGCESWKTGAWSAERKRRTLNLFPEGLVWNSVLTWTSLQEAWGLEASFSLRTTLNDFTTASEYKGISDFGILECLPWSILILLLIRKKNIFRSCVLQREEVTLIWSRLAWPESLTFGSHWCGAVLRDWWQNPCVVGDVGIRLPVQVVIFRIVCRGTWD